MTDRCSNELYHYGVKGMKWGVRRAGKKVGRLLENKATKNAEKAQKRKERINRSTDIFGVGGVALGTYVKTSAKIGAKGTLAKTINLAANAYISSGLGNYYTQQGVHYARKAAISGLSISAYADVIRGFRDIGQSYVHAASKYASR